MGETARLSGLALNVMSPTALASFYTDYLGMTPRDDVERNDDIVRLSYGAPGASVELRPSLSSAPYNPDPLDEYWKIGITLPNVDMAADQLRRAGIEVTPPRQFQDIGYMCHFTDPEGFQIELLQHTFEEQKRTTIGDPDLPLGGGAQIGQITLRVTDIDDALAHYQNTMSMSLLSKQVVEGRGFTLYFLAFTDEVPPLNDIEAVENRPWLWQRPYTTLELQHITDPNASIRPAVSGATGYAELLFDQA